MSYMDEKYNSRLLTVNRNDGAIGPMNRGSTSWSSMNSGSREGMMRSSVDRDVMAQVRRDREGIEHMERDGVARTRMERDSLARLRINRDDIGRGHVGRDDLAMSRMHLGDLPQSHLDRGNVVRGRLDVGDMPSSHKDIDWRRMDRDWRHLERDARFQRSIDRDDMLRVRDDLVRAPLDREDLPRGSLNWELLSRLIIDWGSVDRGPLDRDALGHGPLDRVCAPPGPTKKDPMLTIGKTEDQMGKGDATRETASGSVNKEKWQGSVDRDKGDQSDMEISDMEMSDVEYNEMVLSGVKQNNNANSTGPKKEETTKGGGAENSKKKYHCEAMRAAENSGLSVMTTSKKMKKINKTLKDYMAEPVREPLIGLEHVLEYIPPGNVKPIYHCELCDFKAELAAIIQHLIGFKHRKDYISKEFPFLPKAPPGQKEDLVQFFRSMAADIERDGGLKMYRASAFLSAPLVSQVDVPTKKKKLKPLSAIKPDEIDIKRNRFTSDSPVIRHEANTGSDNTIPNKEPLEAKVLQCLETYKIDSDNEAVTVMMITQRLTENLQTYFLKVKEETEQAEKVARSRIVDEALSQINRTIQPGPQDTLAQVHLNPQQAEKVARARIVDEALAQINRAIQPGRQDTFGSGSFPSGGGNQHLAPIHNNQPTPFPARGPNQNQDTMQNQPPLGGRPPNEPCGPSGSPSGNRGFGNEFNLPARGPIAGSMPVGPSSILNQPGSFPRNNLLTPGINRLIGVPKGETFIRSFQNQGAAFKPASQTNFNAGPNMMPGNFSAAVSNPELQRSGNLNLDPLISKHQMPQDQGAFPAQNTAFGNKQSHLDLSSSMAANIGVTDGKPKKKCISAAEFSFRIEPKIMPEKIEYSQFQMPMMPETEAIPLIDEILTRIQGTDFTRASIILDSLAASNPALQKVNITELLNLLVQSGTIKPE